MIEESPYKIYVDVNVEFQKDGTLIPRSIIWDDGIVYEIQKVTDVRRAASLIAGGTGIRYTVYIDGYESHLYFGDNRRWFVEGKSGTDSSRNRCSEVERRMRSAEQNQDCEAGLHGCGANMARKKREEMTESA